MTTVSKVAVLALVTLLELTASPASRLLPPKLNVTVDPVMGCHTVPSTDVYAVYVVPATATRRYTGVPPVGMLLCTTALAPEVGLYSMTIPLPGVTKAA
jgi:hypothetical protein